LPRSQKNAIVRNSTTGRKMKRRPSGALFKVIALPVSIFVLLTACASVSSRAPAYARAPNPPASSANVYVYRIGAYPTLRTPTIKIDGARIFDPPEKAYTVVTLEEGEHQFIVNWAWDTGWPDLEFPLQVRAGTPMYVKISGSFDASSSDANVMGSLAQLVPEAAAEAELRACCRYMAPRAR
jgi:hypothetical protein